MTLPKLSAGWLALVAGAATVLALPPFSWLPVLPFSLCAAYFAWNSVAVWPRPGRARAFVGWMFGVGYFAAGLYWVSYAFLVDAETYGWMIPFALVGLGAGLGLFTALAFWLAGFAKGGGFARWAGFAAAWMAVEWVRSWALTGFPWNPLGVVWAFHPAMIQGAAVVGVFGLSWYTLLAMTAPMAGHLGAFGARKGAWKGVGVAVAMVAVQGLGGLARVPDAPQPVQDGVLLRLVQPDIPQTLKWDPVLRRDHLVDQVILSRAAGWEKVTHVIWSETAATFPIDGAENTFARNIVAQAAPPGGWLITGAPRVSPQGEPRRLWNSVIAVDRDGETGAIFDKAHLVPFGEYVPLGGILPVTKITAGRTDFSPGPGVRTVHLPGTPAYSPLVCYEVIFPGAVVDAADRPEWLLNLTNDAWFGLSAGPHQHFAAAIFRAVEEGLPLVRDANTGISAVVDPYGRVVASLDLGQRGVLDSPLPRPLSATIYAWTGNWSGFLLAMVFILAPYFIPSRLRLRLPTTT
jgi:apolipoprotein N-acyltransferase